MIKKKTHATVALNVLTNETEVSRKCEHKMFSASS